MTEIHGMTAAALRRWRWRRAATVAGTGAARYAKIGDSISAGQGLQPSTQSPPVVMAGMLAAQGFPVRGASVIMNPRTRTADSRLAFRGAWSELDQDALTTYAASRTAGDSIEFTASIGDAGDYRARVIHGADSRPFRIGVDGGEAVLVTPRGGVGPMATEIPLQGLAAGEHRVTVTVAGDAGVLQVGSIGIEASAGIAVGDFGISMSTTEDWVAGGAPYSALRHVVAWAPDLAIIALMTNDAHGLAVPPDRYAANLRAMVDALVGDCDVVLEVQIPGDPALVDLDPYRKAVYAVADETGVPVLDLFDRWGDFGAARDAGLMNDMFHPNATGAADIAAAELAVVTA
ncbi:SGNH/GDSL hydrolase family protein [Kribbella sp. NPDC051770]|uniref:SGNH/GDSL hydrolase family protein n=1 Tax=Kribbella sp. NPDC051770 TaxID=3155413 RepID=UPI00342C4760